MKKRFAQVGLLLVMLTAVGCGRETPEEVISNEPAVTSTPTPEVVVEKKEEVIVKNVETVITSTPTPEAVIEEKEEVIEEVAIEEIDDVTIIALNDNEERIGRGRYDSKDQTSAYRINNETVLPYYVGRNDESATNFLKNNKTESDGVLYLGMPMYLPDNLLSKVEYVSVSDTDIAKIEGNELIGLKQGSFVLTSYDKDMNIVEEKPFFVTTYNDSKDNKESLLTFAGNLSDYSNARDFDYWKNSVKTIQDMCWMLQARNFVYDFNKEPEFGYTWNTGNSYDVWTWTANAETIFEMSGGVCIQVAQLATAMLADDYEDWGAVLVEGNQGHIFNWFYEDGIFYVFDFTQVISENWEYINDIFFRDYTKYVVKCNSIEEIKEYCLNNKVSLEHNYAIYMYSCKGYDFLPCNVNTGMSDSNGCLNGTFIDGDKDYITIRFQDIVMEDLHVLWENPKSSTIVWESVDLKNVGADIPYVYGKDKYQYRFNY